MMGSVVGIRGQRRAVNSKLCTLLRKRKGASSAVPKVFSAAPLTQISQLFYLRSRAQELKQQLLPEFYWSGM